MQAADADRSNGAHRHGYLVCRVPDADTQQTIAHVANHAASANPGFDLLLLENDFQAPSAWLQWLGDLARAESTTATVSLLHESALDLEGGTVRSLHPDSVASDLHADGPTPRVQVVEGPCVFVARGSFNLLGGLDEELPTSGLAIADFGLRACQRGLANLIATSFVAPSGPKPGLTAADDSTLLARFPSIATAAKRPASAAFERGVLMARTRQEKISVTIDARALAASAGGTQTYTAELVRRLAATGELQIRAVVGPDSEVAAQLEALEGTTVITYEQALARPEATDLVHRPQQVFTGDDLALLRPLGKRLVITHLDLIAYHNPAYFPGASEWQRHVRATRIALAAADHAIFFSSHALHDAEREDLIDRARASVVPLGVDRPAPPATARRPARLTDLHRPFVLCLGADYKHKNRPFAFELVAELTRRHDWRGTLVLAGPHVACGSSDEEEREVAGRRRELDGSVLDLGPVTEDERQWLIHNARALLYPSVLEGFGLVPFEAAAASVPCIFASQGSLGELLPRHLATLDEWDLEKSAAASSRLLRDDAARAEHVRGLRGAAEHLAWSRCTRSTLEVYRRTIASPAKVPTIQVAEGLEREQEVVRLDAAVQSLRARALELQTDLQALGDSFGADATALVGPNGLLSAADQRALLALAVRPRLRAPLLASARAAYRLGRDGRRGR